MAIIKHLSTDGETLIVISLKDKVFSTSFYALGLGHNNQADWGDKDCTVKFSLYTRLLLWRRKVYVQSKVTSVTAASLGKWLARKKWVLAKCFSFFCLCERSYVCSYSVRIPFYFLIRSCWYFKNLQHSHVSRQPTRMALNVKMCFLFLCLDMYQCIIKWNKTLQSDKFSLVSITLKVNLWLSREICTSRNVGNLNYLGWKEGQALFCVPFAGGGWYDLSTFSFECFLSLC